MTKETPLIFECDGDRLLGIAHLPDGAAERFGVVIVVGGPQYRVGSHRQFTLIARDLASRGYSVLRFDYRGMGDSDGAMTTFEHVDADIEIAIGELYKLRPDLEGVILWGLCDAATACLMYAKKEDSRVVGMILANPWVRTLAGEATSYLRHYYLQRLLQGSFWRKALKGAFNPVRSLREFFGMVAQSQIKSGPNSEQTFIERALDGLCAFRGSILLLISENDLTAKEFVEFSRSQAAWSTALDRDTIVRRELDGIDHTFSNPGALTTVNTVCADWLERLYIQPNPSRR